MCGAVGYRRLRALARDDDLRAALHPRLAAEIIDVPLHRGHAQHEAMGDLKVGGAGADPYGQQ